MISGKGKTEEGGKHFSHLYFIEFDFYGFANDCLFIPCGR
jgi:hypothetical protein